MSTDNIALIKEGYANFAKGNMDGVLAVWDPAIEWHECKGMPIVNSAAKLVGHQAVMEGIMATIPQHFDGFGIEIGEMFGSDDRVVMIGSYVGTFKATGKPFKAAVAHIWTLKNGRAVKMIQVADTAEIINPKP
jgi:ketosteroid isomerase-like protein